MLKTHCFFLKRLNLKKKLIQLNKYNLFILYLYIPILFNNFILTKNYVNQLKSNEIIDNEIIYLKTKSATKRIEFPSERLVATFNEIKRIANK
jgi:hypothetical protein